MKKMMIFAAVAMAAVALAQAPAKPAAAPKAAPKAAPAAPVASALDVMKAMTEPGSKALWQAAVTAPKDDKDWEALANASIVLAESGNVLMMPGVTKNAADWNKWSRIIVAAGGASLKAARAKDLDKLLEAGDSMVESCDECHNKYMLAKQQK